LTRLARRKNLAILLTGLVAIGARLAVLPIQPVPHPSVADEFSFLLAANTFAHGRLTNPTPPMWVHFETLHVLMKPTFMSMYPPAQGMFLAAGKVATGLPFAGVLLSAGLMCAAMVWMLQGWFAPGWAFLGGMIALMRFGVFSYWTNSYWGGAVAALGGALVLGALPRIVRLGRPRDAVWMGLGLAILANSRPYEGFVFSIPIAFALFAWLLKKKDAGLTRAMGRVVAPLTLVVLLAAAGTGYYFWRVTGNAFEMPQEFHRDQYAVAPYFLWSSLRPTPAYDQAALRDFHLRSEMGFYEEGRTALGLLGIEIVRFTDWWAFYLGPVLTLPLLFALALLPRDSVWARCDRRTHFLLIAAAVSVAGLSLEVFYFDHYAAPMTCLILALVIEALRRLRAWRSHGRPVGRMVARAVPVVCLLMLVVRAGATSFGLPVTPTWPPLPYNSVDQITEFTRINEKLDAHPGKHLVLLRYDPSDKLTDLWVYNESGDIGAERNVWAWDMGAEKNQQLIRSYPDREVWLVIPEGGSAKLMRYEDATRH
jgi:hypothetical protein